MKLYFFFISCLTFLKKIYCPDLRKVQKEILNLPSSHLGWTSKLKFGKEHLENVLQFGLLIECPQNWSFELLTLKFKVQIFKWKIFRLNFYLWSRTKSLQRINIYYNANTILLIGYLVKEQNSKEKDLQIRL